MLIPRMVSWSLGRLLTLFVLTLSLVAESFSQIDCCAVTDLEDCVRIAIDEEYRSAMASLQSASSSSPMLVTYFTSDIAPHSLLSFSINRQYAHTHRYSILATRPETGHEHDTNDQRWNKVKILLDLLDESLPGQVLVWVDSDLIFNLQLFSIESLLSEYPEDLIISREVDPKNGVANTGLMVLRNSAWTRAFLARWWAGYDRAGGMDQHVFDHLYDHHSELSPSKHIALLPATTINSAFPGLVTHQDGEPVLHLAGESNFVRRFLFQKAWDALCASPSHRIGPLISRSAIDAADYLALHQREWDDITRSLATLAVAPVAPTALIQMRYKVREAQQSASKFVCNYSLAAQGTAPNCTSIKQRFQAPARDALHSIFSALMASTEAALAGYEPRDGRRLAQDELSLLQSTLDTALEYLLVAFDDEQQRTVLEAAQRLVHELLLPHVSPSAEAGAMYYAFKVSEFLGAFHLRAGRGVHAMVFYEEALLHYRQLHHVHRHFGSGNQLTHRHREGIHVGVLWMELVCAATLSRAQYVPHTDSVVDGGVYTLALIMGEDVGGEDFKVPNIASPQFAALLAAHPGENLQPFVRFGLAAAALLRSLNEGGALSALELAVVRHCVKDGEVSERCRSWATPSLCDAATWEDLLRSAEQFVSKSIPFASPADALRLTKLRRKRRDL